MITENPGGKSLTGNVNCKETEAKNKGIVERTNIWKWQFKLWGCIPCKEFEGQSSRNSGQTFSWAGIEDGRASLEEIEWLKREQESQWHKGSHKLQEKEFLGDRNRGQLCQLQLGGKKKKKKNEMKGKTRISYKAMPLVYKCRVRDASWHV